MCVKAIVLNDKAEEFHLRLLALMFRGVEARIPVRVSYKELAETLGSSTEDVRYNIRKLLRLGYIVSCGGSVGYMLTDKVLIVKKTGA